MRHRLTVYCERCNCRPAVAHGPPGVMREVAARTLEDARRALPCICAEEERVLVVRIEPCK